MRKRAAVRGPGAEKGGSQQATGTTPGTVSQKPIPLSWWHAALVFAGLLLVLAAAYQPAWNGGILWDDAGHLTRPELQSWHGLWRIWCDIGATQQYYPLVHSMFWLLSMLWGSGTLAPHLLNLLFHASS